MPASPNVSTKCRQAHLLTRATIRTPAANACRARNRRGQLRTTPSHGASRMPRRRRTHRYCSRNRVAHPSPSAGHQARQRQAIAAAAKPRARTVGCGGGGHGAQDHAEIRQARGVAQQRILSARLDPAHCQNSAPEQIEPGAVAILPPHKVNPKVTLQGWRPNANTATDSRPITIAPMTMPGRGQTCAPRRRATSMIRWRQARDSQA